jgi:hypothetical protein
VFEQLPGVCGEPATLGVHIGHREIGNRTFEIDMGRPAQQQL